MSFDSACKFCYDNFKNEYETGIGNIQDCGDYWIFYRKSDETAYGILPIIIYKGDRHPVLMTFDIYLKLSDDIANATEVPVPQEYVR